jgi:DNA-binding YbaB/EbfC family protein
MSGFDLDAILKQAKDVHQRMAERQAELARSTVVGEAGGGLVQVHVNGMLEVVSITLDPVCVDARDVKMLQDLVVLATNKALSEAKERMERELGAVMRPTGLSFGAGR